MEIIYSGEHYFNKNKSYENGFLDAFKLIFNDYKDSKKEQLLKDKYFFLFPLKFNGNQFCEYACELSVGAYYKKRGCKVEPNVKVNGTKKDIDWQIKHNNYTFNLEVKCSEEDEFNNSLEQNGEASLKFKTSGRLKDKNEMGRVA